jgi:hypothetical protein
VKIQASGTNCGSSISANWALAREKIDSYRKLPVLVTDAEQLLIAVQAIEQIECGGEVVQLWQRKRMRRRSDPSRGTVRAWGYGEERRSGIVARTAIRRWAVSPSSPVAASRVGEKLVLEQVGELEKLLTEGEDHGFPEFRLIRKPHGWPDGAVNTTNILGNVPNVQGTFARAFFHYWIEAVISTLNVGGI